jgi:hypothetical protein
MGKIVFWSFVEWELGCLATRDKHLDEFGSPVAVKMPSKFECHQRTKTVPEQGKRAIHPWHERLGQSPDHFFPPGNGRFSQSRLTPRHLYRTNFYL